MWDVRGSALRTLNQAPAASAEACNEACVYSTCGIELVYARLVICKDTVQLCASSCFPLDEPGTCFVVQ